MGSSIQKRAVSADNTEDASADRARESMLNYLKYRKYFTEFLPRIVGRLMLSDLKDLSTHVEIVVTDSGDPPWQLTVDNGKLTHVGQDGPNPVCRFLLNTETLLEIVTAQVSPQDAFFEMRIEIEKDIERGLELSVVLGAFFENFCFDIS